MTWTVWVTKDAGRSQREYTDLEDTHVVELVQRSTRTPSVTRISIYKVRDPDEDAVDPECAKCGHPRSIHQSNRGYCMNFECVGRDCASFKMREGGP